MFQEHFHRLQLRPLTDAQQREVIDKRLGADPRLLTCQLGVTAEGTVELRTRVRLSEAQHGAWQLARYVQSKVPIDATTQARVTGNPLMLSMVVSIFESRGARGMPTTISQLYATASKAMLERVDHKARGAAAAAAAVPNLERLLEAAFFEAHAAQKRVIELVHLERAAIAVFALERLNEIVRTEAALLPPFVPVTASSRPQIGCMVQVAADAEDHAGDRGVLIQDDHDETPFLVEFDSGATDWFTEDQVLHCGLDKAGLDAWRREQTAPRVREVVEALPSEAHHALRIVRERVEQDRLPLFSLLQTEPLQVQSSHLSFQEYYFARAICAKTRLLPVESAQPWQWPVWWANALKLGMEMGVEFARGLLIAAGVTTTTLDLSRKLGGDRPTSLLAVACLLRAELTSVDVRHNDIEGEGASQLSAAVLANTRIERFNEIPIKEIRSGSLTSLDLAGKAIGVAGAMVVAGLALAMSSVTELNLTGNAIGDAGVSAICEAVQSNKEIKLVSLNVGNNRIGSEGAKSVVAMAAVTASVTHIDVRNNGIKGDGASELSAAVLANTRIEKFNEIPIKEIRSGSLTSLDLAGKAIGVEGAMVVAGLALAMSSVTELNLNGNAIGDAGVSAICEAVQSNKEIKLVSLNVRNTGIGSEGAKSVVAMAAVTASVTHIDVRNNSIKGDGASELSAAVLANTRIEEVQ